MATFATRYCSVPFVLVAVLGVCGPWVSGLRAAHESESAESGAERGRHDGATKGREKGRSEGFIRALTEAHLDGFLRGLHDLPDDRAIDEAREEGWDEGFRLGEDLGREAGLIEGRMRAAALYGQLRGRPLRPYFETPDVPSLRSADWPACGRPKDLEISYSGCRSVSLDPRDLEDGHGPFAHDPDPKIASAKRRRAAARRAGFSESVDVEAWAVAYREAYGPAYLSAYRDRQLELPRHRLRWQRHEGRHDGQAESLRRSSCRAHEHGFRRGLERGHAEGFGRAVTLGWDEVAELHDNQAVLRVRSAELLDASGDGVLEPGEKVRLRVSIANHGMLAANERGMDLRGLVGLKGGGQVAQGLPAQELISEDRALGRVDEDALPGSSAVVSLTGPDGLVEEVSAEVRRPVVLEDLQPRFEARDGQLVLEVRATISSVASLSTERGLRLILAEDEVALGIVAAEERRAVLLLRPLSSSEGFGSARLGQVVLTEAVDQSWGSLPYEVLASLEDAVRLDAELDEAFGSLDFVRRELDREFLAAHSRPKLYKERKGKSILARYVAALRLAPRETRARFAAEVSGPLLESAEARSTPRKVRRAIRKAFK